MIRKNSARLSVVFLLWLTSCAHRPQTETPLLDNAIALGLKNMAATQNPDDQNRPYFVGFMFPEKVVQSFGDAGEHTPENPELVSERHMVSNISGRGVYAFYVGSRAIEQAPETDALAHYTRYLLRSLHQERPNEPKRFVGLPGDPATQTGFSPDMHYLYNIGAGMRGLVALSLFAGEPRLLNQAVDYLKDYYVSAVSPYRYGFNWEGYRREFQLRGGREWQDNSESEVVPDWSLLNKDWTDPFQLYALVKYFEQTKDPKVLQLATALKDYAFLKRFPFEEKKVPVAQFTHMFEPIAEMNAYSRLAHLNGSLAELLRVRARYDALVNRGLISPTGWVPENRETESDVGESNNTAELIETVLTFAEAGWTEFYETAERYLRGQLLPSQLTNPDLISTEGAGSRNGNTGLKKRLVGSFPFSAPYGLVATKKPYLSGAAGLDCTSGAIASLAEAKKKVMSDLAGVPYINLLFDFRNERLQFIGPYGENSGKIKFELNRGAELCVRFPSWGNRPEFKKQLEDNLVRANWVSNFVCFQGLVAGRRYEFDLPLKITPARFKLNGREVNFAWRGDEVAYMDAMGSPYPFHPPPPPNKL